LPTSGSLHHGRARGRAGGMGRRERQEPDDDLRDPRRDPVLRGRWRRVRSGSATTTRSGIRRMRPQRILAPSLIP